LEKALPIPYTPRALNAYEIIIQTVQTILMKILQMHLARIELQSPNLLLPGIYGPENFTEKERKKYEEIVRRLHPPRREPVNHKLIITSTVARKDIQWYLNLSSFLDICKARADKKPSE
jgi:hypothetical protein